MNMIQNCITCRINSQLDKHKQTNDLKMNELSSYIDLTLLITYVAFNPGKALWY